MNEKVKYCIYGVCVVAAVFALWFLFRDIGYSTDSNVETGLQRTQDNIERVQDGIDGGRQTVEAIERNTENSTDTARRIKQRNNEAKDAVDRAADADSNAQSSVERSIESIDRGIAILDKYKE